MTDIYEQEDLTTVNVLGEFMPKVHSKYVNVVQPLIDDLTYTLVAWAGSAAELSKAIADKQQELKAYYLALNAGDGFEFDFRTIFGLKALYMVPVHTNPNANLQKAFDGFDVAVAELVVIGALANKAAVDAYLVDSTPAWPA